MLCYLLVLTGFSAISLTAAAGDACDYTDGSERRLMAFQFYESYGAADHLATRGEEHQAFKNFGTARLANDSKAIAANTYVLRLSDLQSLKFENGTLFYPVDTYFDLRIRSGLAYLYLKQGLDREIMSFVYTSGKPGTTQSGKSFEGNYLQFTVECRPDDSALAARNFTFVVGISDVNDYHPVFYNASDNTNHTEFYGTVSEATPDGQLVFEGVEARDLDGWVNAVTKVSVLENPYFLTREINSAVRLFTKKRIDYDAFGVPNPTVPVILIAVDSPTNTSMVLTSTATVIFTILKDDDIKRPVSLWPFLTSGFIVACLLALAIGYVCFRRSQRRDVLAVPILADNASYQSTRQDDLPQPESSGASAVSAGQGHQSSSNDGVQVNTASNNDDMNWMDSKIYGASE